MGSLAVYPFIMVWHESCQAQLMHKQTWVHPLCKFQTKQLWDKAQKQMAEGRKPWPSVGDKIKPRNPHESHAS